MKKILFLFVSTLALGLTSCSKDDDSDSTPASIEGKWDYFQEGVLVGNQELLEAYSHDCTTKKDYTEFVAGGVLKDVYYYDNCAEEIDLGTWSRNGNTLTVNLGGETANAEILVLDSQTLKVKSTFEGVTYIQVVKRR